MHCYARIALSLFVLAGTAPLGGHTALGMGGLSMSSLNPCSKDPSLKCFREKAGQITLLEDRLAFAKLLLQSSENENNPSAAADAREARAMFKLIADKPVIDDWKKFQLEAIKSYLAMQQEGKGLSENATRNTVAEDAEFEMYMKKGIELGVRGSPISASGALAHVYAIWLDAKGRKDDAQTYYQEAQKLGFDMR